MEINGVKYTKTRVREIIKKIIVPKYKGTKEKLNQRSFDFMMGVFKHHSNWKEKMGCGVSHILCEREYNDKSYCFYLHRKDGSIVHISWRHCVERNSTGMLATIKHTARMEIVDQIIDFRKTNNVPKDFEIDHCGQSFSSIWAKFLLENNMKECDIEIGGDKKDVHFKDRSLSEKWKDYHSRKSYLRALEPKRNISMGNYNKGQECSCGGQGLTEVVNTIDGRNIYKSVCSICGAYIKFLKKEEVFA